jgi:hypothetical protein
VLVTLVVSRIVTQPLPDPLLPTPPAQDPLQPAPPQDPFAGPAPVFATPPSGPVYPATLPGQPAYAAPQPYAEPATAPVPAGPVHHAYAPPPGAPAPYQQYLQPFPPPNPGLNGLAVASLVVSLCSGPFLATIFGIIALVQIKRRGGSGKGLAIAGLTISGIWYLAFAVALIVAIMAPGAERDDSGRITQGGQVALEKLQAGDCVQSFDEDRIELYYDLVPCSITHNAQVYGVFELTGSTFPGQEAADEQSNLGCDSRFFAGVKPEYHEDESFDYYYINPTSQTWRTGDRQVVCFAVKPAQTSSIMAD